VSLDYAHSRSLQLADRVANGIADSLTEGSLIHSPAFAGLSLELPQLVRDDFILLGMLGGLGLATLLAFFFLF
jgi:hypothetical protein